MTIIKIKSSDTNSYTTCLSGILIFTFILLSFSCRADLSVGSIIRKAQENKPVVVIDPGHGGKDPGAIGPSGTMEKDIVLAVSKLLALMLESDGKIKVVMTRKDDRYISLQERVSIARKANAELMISVHADSANNKKASGSSIFVLNEKGASDNAAKLLARKENASFAEFDGIDMSNTDVAGILVSMRQAHNINESSRLAEDIIGEFERVLSVSSRGVRYAPFAVLKTYNVPAVLFELGFLSNKKEEQILKRRSFQVSAAYGMANGIRTYLGLIPKPVATGCEHKDALQYNIRSGDTLWDLSRAFCVPLSKLLKTNKLNEKSYIQIGQRIIIPFS